MSGFLKYAARKWVKTTWSDGPSAMRANLGGPCVSMLFWSALEIDLLKMVREAAQAALEQAEAKVKSAEAAQMGSVAKQEMAQAEVKLAQANLERAKREGF